jgi:hypothetical protein
MYASAGAICACSRRFRAITALMLSETGPPPISTPSSALRRTSLRARAERKSAPRATQPTSKQSPPATYFSTSAHVAPRRAACLAEMRPRPARADRDEVVDVVQRAQRPVERRHVVQQRAVVRVERLDAWLARRALSKPILVRPSSPASRRPSVGLE